MPEVSKESVHCDLSLNGDETGELSTELSTSFEIVVFTGNLSET